MSVRFQRFVGVKNLQVSLGNGDFNVVLGHAHLVGLSLVGDFLFPDGTGEFAPVVEGQAGVERVASRVSTL